MTDKQANDITKEQAIRILHPDTRVEAIDDYEEAGNYEYAYDMAILMAIAALRDSQPDPDTGLKGCWHCRNIEAHHIEYVIAVKAKGGTPMNMPVDCPYHYCPACGRKLEVEG